MAMKEFKITKPRYVNGEYVNASPRKPATITIDVPEKRPDGKPFVLDRGLIPMDADIEAPKPHHAGKTVGGRAQPAHTRDLKHEGHKHEGSKSEAETDHKHHAKRDSDKSPI
jgi:hypothetical protein